MAPTRSLVSGGFTFFADYIGKRIGFDEAMANTLEFDGDLLTGTVADPIVGKRGQAQRGCNDALPPTTTSRWQRRLRSATAPTIST